MKTTDSSKPTVSLAKSMLIGGGIGLLLISFFVFGVDNPNPEWPRFWYIRPLIVTPIAAAMGGAFFFFMDYQASRGFNRTLAILMGMVGFLVALWLGSILGLDGTMWN